MMPSGVKVYLASEPVDFRKGPDILRSDPSLADLSLQKLSDRLNELGHHDLEGRVCLTKLTGMLDLSALHRLCVGLLT